MRFERLIELRKEKHVSQRELGNLLGISDAAYGRYERGIAEPNVESLIKLADFYNVSIDYLVGRSDIRNVDELAKKIVSLSDEEKQSVSGLVDLLLKK